MASAEMVRPERVRMPARAWAIWSLMVEYPHNWMKNKTFMDVLGYSRRGVQTGVKWLVEHTVIDRELTANTRDLYLRPEAAPTLRPPAQSGAPSVRPLPLSMDRVGIKSRNVVGSRLPTSDRSSKAAASLTPRPNGPGEGDFGAEADVCRSTPPTVVVDTASQIAELEELLRGPASGFFRDRAEADLARLRSGVQETAQEAPPPTPSFYPDPPSRTPRKAERRKRELPPLDDQTRHAGQRLGALIRKLPGASYEAVRRTVEAACQMWDDEHSRKMYWKLFAKVSRGRLSVAIPIGAWEAAYPYADKREARMVFTSLVSKGVKTTAVR